MMPRWSVGTGSCAEQLSTAPIRVPAFSTEDLVRRYVIAKRMVVDSGYEGEIAWQAGVQVRDVTGSTFLREAAWVVLSAGMRERVVRARFPLLRSALHDFEPSAVVHDPEARPAALLAFRHERKIDAILSIARVAFQLGTSGIRRSLAEDPGSLLRHLPYMGPATARHLAKNLGVCVAKPDRHLVRLARATDRADPDGLCTEIAHWLGDSISVVDVVLWRWATLHQGRCEARACDGLPHV